MSLIIKSQKANVLEEIKKGLREVKKIRQGKAKSYSMSDLLSKKH